MELKRYNLDEEEYEIFQLSEIIKKIEEFGDGPLEFETSKIAAMVDKLHQLEQENKELKEELEQVYSQLSG